MSQTLPLIELTGILELTDALLCCQERRNPYLLYIYCSRIQNRQDRGIYVRWWQLCCKQGDLGTVCTASKCACSEQELVRRENCQI